MRFLVIGTGFIGRSLISTWRKQGHEVVGTTTTPGKVESLRSLCSEVKVLRGSDRQAVAEAAKGADAIVVTVTPPAERDPDKRELTYRDVLLDTCQSAAAALPRTVFLSAFSVYGDGGEGSEPISEDSALSDADEPSTKYYRRSEEAVLANPAGAALRLPDIYGAEGDMSFADRIRMGIEHMGGRVPFSPDALLYRIHHQDVVGAVDHIVRNNLTGAFNICRQDLLPPTNKQVFDQICDARQWPRLAFLDAIRAPTRAISAARIGSAGWRTAHTDYHFG